MLQHRRRHWSHLLLVLACALTSARGSAQMMSNPVHWYDDRLAQQARDMAREGLEKLLGVPIDRIRINSAGLSP